jgi:glycosyltransferase involved in cell wall biosynthesis
LIEGVQGSTGDERGLANSSLADEHLRVLHFIDSSDAAGYFSLIAEYTDRSRFELSVGSLRGQGPLHERLGREGVRTFAVGARTRRDYPGAVVRLARRLCREKVDVLHMHLLEASIVGVAAATLARTPLVVFTGHHSHEVPLHNRRLLLEVDRTLCRLSDVVIAPSLQMAQGFIDDYGCPPEKVEVIHHGLDLRRFDPAAHTGDRFRAELGWEDALLLVVISKHHWIKNVRGLLEAFSTFSGRYPEARLAILGIGDYTENKALVAGLGLSETVRVLDPRPDISEVLAAADLLVHPALAESFGFAILEAMAMSKPVVTTAVGVAPEVIEDGVNGILANGTDPESLSLALERALAKRAEWPEMGRAARERALGFSAQRWVTEHEECYVRRLRQVQGNLQISRSAGSHGSRAVSLRPRRMPRNT